VLVETLSLKKYLAELPKKVIESIRSNVTNTMETETKSLREELAKTSEILDQLPGSLNVYVEQVNTLKYVKEKQEEFSQKFQTISKLYQLCKQDNIKVGLNLQQAIDEVSHLYE
jgi:flagellar biosynthesis/type III secretory pathway chaperone